MPESKEAVRENGAPLRLDPDYTGDTTEPAKDYTLFEADPVRPIAMLAKSGLIAVVNTNGDSLDLARTLEDGGVSPSTACGSIHVGMRPVAVAVTEEADQKATLWVVNQLSDSISVVRVNTVRCNGEVADTIHVGDEPRDIVVTEMPRRVFVTAAHRGQHHAVEAARSGSDLVHPPNEKATPGLADVFVFDPDSYAAPISVVNLFTDTPRSLAAGKGTVYAAGFHTGNRTTLVPAHLVAQVGVESLLPLLNKDAAGHFVEHNGKLELAPGMQGKAKISGGMPAVSGKGRCLPDPRPESRDDFKQGVCVKTDREHHVLDVSLVQPGVVQTDCQCTSGDGTVQPTVGVLVKFFSDAQSCGRAYGSLPDGSRGCWLDAAPEGAHTPAAHGANQAPPMAWNQHVKVSLPDQDVFAIDADSLAVTRSYSGVGTVLFAMAVDPARGDVFVLNTDAQNLTRFEGAGEHSSTTVRGHLYESRVSVLGGHGRVKPIHLNNHIDYSKCCDRNAGEAEKSLAFPTSGAFSPDGRYFYLTALGSDKVVRIESSALRGRFSNTRARQTGALKELFGGTDPEAPVGPVALALSPDGATLYVKTHFTNELIVLDAASGEVRSRIPLRSPEPESITKGRSLLYNATLTSAHGDSACASCHIFGDLDSVSWDLGDPDSPTVKNPGPYAIAPENVIPDIVAQDPTTTALVPDFRSNKGPMATQTLRGMANQGAQHWRGDRTRNFQDAPGEHPNFGSLDENNSFNEFDVAIAGLNGNDRSLDAHVFQDFTNFTLQLTLPPNPVRNLDNSLTAEQAAGRAVFFGCSSMSDAEFDAGTCSGLSSKPVHVDEETEQCACASNSILRVMDATPQIAPFAQAIQGVLSVPSVRQEFLAAARDTSGLPAEVAPTALALATQLEMAIGGLTGVQFLPDAKKLVPLPAATALAQSTGALLAVLQLSQKFGTPVASNMLGILWGALPPEAHTPGTPFESPLALGASLPDTFGFANLTIRVQVDEQARGTAEFHNLLFGCEVGVARSCDLRETDSLHTCHGCHTLDPKGNAEFDVYRPGFFGTSGRYSFENESQFMKVPHLRNLYRKAGMFGTPVNSFVLPEPALGAKKGGFFGPDHAFTGPQVRGFGFMHDGELDTTHRFFGAVVFIARPASGGIDPGNSGAFEVVLPRVETRAACVTTFRAASLEALPPLPPELTQALAFCGQASGLPDSCFLNPTDPVCQGALSQMAQDLGSPEFSQQFVEQIRPACFQLGSTLEGGSENGICAPEGLGERSNMEAFMMAFDTNLKPMVGQQITLQGHHDTPRLLQDMLKVAARGDCDVVAFQSGKGFVVTEANSGTPKASKLKDVKGHTRTLSSLMGNRMKPLTFTCYPPQPRQTEAWAQVKAL